MYGTDIRSLFDRLWEDYVSLNPAAARIHRLLRRRGERVRNDHIALRTFDDPRVALGVLARPFEAAGYVPKGEYRFAEKHLFARHYEHADSALPTVFISELLLDAFTDDLRRAVDALLDTLPPGFAERSDLPVAGRPWEVSHATYEALRRESEYAAWLAAFGFRANHFTVDVGALVGFPSLERLNDFLAAEGFSLNDAGGVVKGTPESGLVQSSTWADPVAVAFTDGTHEVPSTYYEFAQRFADEHGQVFRGFVVSSADKIFESTDVRS